MIREMISRTQKKKDQMMSQQLRERQVGKPSTLNSKKKKAPHYLKEEETADYKASIKLEEYKSICGTCKDVKLNITAKYGLKSNLNNQNYPVGSSVAVVGNSLPKNDMEMLNTSDFGREESKGTHLKSASRHGVVTTDAQT